MRPITILLVIILATPVVQAENPFDALELKYERHKLKENREAIAEGDLDAVDELDCHKFIRADGFCRIHETDDPEQCETLASGNWDERVGKWTACKPAADEQGNKLCLAHPRTQRPCYILSHWELAQQDEPAHSGPGPNCKKVYTNEGSKCATHPDGECFALHLECEFHPSRLCGVIDPRSVEQPGDVPVRDGTIMTRPNPLLAMLSRNSAGTVHTRYVWVQRVSEQYRPARPSRQAKR